MSRPPVVHDDDLALEFEALRPRLLAVAYGLLGTVEEAEDAVQEAWLRLGRTNRAELDDLTAWLVVTVSRLAVDILRSARRRREEYVGPWLPEPVTAGPDGDPADRVTLDESLSLAMLVVLESLSPPERAAFVLHDVFGLPFGEVARAVGRTPAACRQLAARARRHVRARAPRFDVTTAEHGQVVAAFARATTVGDLAGLLALLDPDVVWRSDGGGAVRAALRPIVGAAKVARLLGGVWERTGRGDELRPTTVNGAPGLLWLRGDAVYGVLGISVAAGRITGIDVVLNPAKLTTTRRSRRNG